MGKVTAYLVEVKAGFMIVHEFIKIKKGKEQ
jgi:hypothetical protein